MTTYQPLIDRLERSRSRRPEATAIVHGPRQRGDWLRPGPLEAAIRAFAESEGVGLGKFGPALRGILSAGAPAPDLASTLAALGREESLGRLDDALSRHN